MASLSGLLFSSCKHGTDAIAVLDQASFAKAIVSEEKPQLIDVRTAKEFNAGHIKNAGNIDYFQKEAFDQAFDKLNKEAPVYIYCHSGARSKKATRRLADLGFKEIYDLRGGYLGWKK